jgi:hypothetical protein
MAAQAEVVHGGVVDIDRGIGGPGYQAAATSMAIDAIDAVAVHARMGIVGIGEIGERNDPQNNCNSGYC